MSTGSELTPMQRAIAEIRDLRSRVSDLQSTVARAAEPIAIVGAGVRLPGGITDLTGYWQLLLEGRSGIGEVPADRWDVDAFYDADPDAPGRMSIRHGGFLDDASGFDAGFFGISPREAEQMDPQQRVLLEVAWEALEHAGIPASSLFGTDVGVYLGLTNSDYGRMLLADREAIDVYTATGSFASIAAGRLSYILGATGPAVTIDTACSSSLVAVHLAAQALRSNECSLALAGGIGLILTPELTINFSRARMMAADGRCKTFDAAADGYVRSEGCGFVVLKRLSDATADGDSVLAVVSGSAVNQDGRSGGLTAPNGPSQERVVAAALAQAGIAPGAVDYVEAHGTGTPLGDPIEVGALGRTLCRQRPPDAPLLLGSMKTNLGHLEAAAGIAGLLKVVLMLQHGVVPPHLHLDRLNPHIESLGLPIDIPTTVTPWVRRGAARVGGVSSFGISGTNAHVVLSEAPQPAAVPAATEPARPFEVLVWSAPDDAGLRALAGRYADHLDAHPEQLWADVARSANLGRGRLAVGAALVAADSGAAARQLRAFAARTESDVMAVDSPATTPPGVTFVFTGHGSQYAGMGIGLDATEPVFRAALDRCEAILRGTLDAPLREIMFGDGALLDEMRYAQPALFALQYSLVELWRSWGIEPDAVAGHSAGEYVAAVVAGVLSLEDGLSLIATRGRLMSTLPPDGAMVALFLDEATVAAAIEHDSGVDIAAVNGPATTVVSGAAAAVDALIERLGLDHGEFRRLDVPIAAHSPQVDPILDEFEQAVAGVQLRAPQIELISSMTGRAVASEITEAGYWRRHLRSAVRFADVFETLRAAGRDTVLEIGPHPTLVGLGRRFRQDGRAVWAASLHRDGDAGHAVLSGLAQLAAAGVAVDWTTYGAGRPHRRVNLPTYPWQHTSYWAATAAPVGHHPPPLWPAAVAAAERAARSGPLDLRIDTYAERWHLLDQLAVAYIAAAVDQLGLLADPRGEVGVDELVEAGLVGETYRHLVERWLGHLADEGLIERRGDRYAAPHGIAAPDPQAIVDAATVDVTGIEPLLAYVRRCGERLAAVLSGDESALATLFPDGRYDTVDFLYHDWAVARYVNGIAREAAATAASGRPLRIIEIGAGTGGTTAELLPALAPDATSYTFTDVSDFFLARARERFASYPFVQYATLDIERPPAEQGHSTGVHDIVIASNVLHATTNLDTTLTHVRSLLAPGGFLLAYEATNHPRWFDITTGLIEGWQLFEDEWRDDNPLLDAERWAAALAAAGFDEVRAFPSADQPTVILGQHLLIAREPGEAASGRRVVTRPVETQLREAARAAAAVAVPTRAEIDAALAAAPPDDRHDVYVWLVRAAIAHVLRTSDPGHLPRDRPITELGFDSLMAVELRNVLRTSLALDGKLPATLVFDHPNITAIAGFLESTVAAPASAAAATPVVDRTLTGPAASPATTAADLADLSDDEVERLLLERLGDTGARPGA